MKKFGRGLKSIFIFLIVLLSLSAVVGIVFMNAMNYEDTDKVLVFSEDLNKGFQLTSEKLDDKIKYITIPSNAIPKTAYVSKSELIDQFINQDVSAGEFVTKKTLNKEYPFHVRHNIPENKSLVSVKFDRADSANAWNVFNEQVVTILYSPSSSSIMNESYSKYSRECQIQGEIFDIKDSQYYVQGEEMFDPTKLLYITFLVDKEDAIFISHIKDKGRIEVIQ